jgi:hypothetical protein
VGDNVDVGAGAAVRVGVAVDLGAIVCVIGARDGSGVSSALTAL